MIEIAAGILLAAFILWLLITPEGRGCCLIIVVVALLLAVIGAIFLYPTLQ